MGGVGLWHDNHTTLWPILQADICKNSVGLNFKMGRVWQYICMAIHIFGAISAQAKKGSLLLCIYAANQVIHPIQLEIFSILFPMQTLCLPSPLVRRVSVMEWYAPMLPAGSLSCISGRICGVQPTHLSLLTYVTKFQVLLY